MNKEDFLKRYEEWGIDQRDALNFRAKPAIRVNTNLISPKKLIGRLEERKVFTQKVPYLSEGFYVDAVFPLASMIEYLVGYFYIQEIPAQIPGEIIKLFLKTKKFEDVKILDMCAAPGGKTTHLSQLLRNKGKVIAVDSSKSRNEKLVFNLERIRSQNVTVYSTDALTFLAETEFDIILVDAPCSGNFTQDRDWFEKRDMEGIMQRVELQKKLLIKAKDLCKKEGIIVYATCSLEKEENEEVVEFALTKGLTLLDTGIDKGKDGLTEKTKQCKRFLPSYGFPGFFVGVLKKK